MQSNTDSHALLVRTQNGTATLNDSLVASYKSKYTLTIQYSYHTPWYLPKELATYMHTKTCTQIFIAAVFVIAKTGKQLADTLVDE